MADHPTCPTPGSQCCACMAELSLSNSARNLMLAFSESRQGPSNNDYALSDVYACHTEVHRHSARAFARACLVQMGVGRGHDMVNGGSRGGQDMV